jgi:hypothetical protein
MEEKYKAIIDKIIEIHRMGMAVDISARSLKSMPESERDEFLSALTEAIVKEEALKAKVPEEQLRQELTAFYETFIKE